MEELRDDIPVYDIEVRSVVDGASRITIEDGMVDDFNDLVHDIMQVLSEKPQGLVISALGTMTREFAQDYYDKVRMRAALEGELPGELNGLNDRFRRLAHQLDHVRNVALKDGASEELKLSLSAFIAEADQLRSELHEYDEGGSS